MLRTSVCLNMIVRNERKVILRCLESVKPMIHSWLIIDTGSTDGTQDLICNFMKNIPGGLYERPWVNFSVNRNEALSLAKQHSQADYLLFIDADEKLQFSERFVMPDWGADAYLGIVRLASGSEFSRVFLIKRTLNCYWRGVVHEELVCRKKKGIEVLRDPIIYSIGDGNRSRDRYRYFKDAKDLEASLAQDPDNTRIIFLLAQCYLGAHAFEKAMQLYRKRVEMGSGFEGEIYLSLYASAQIERICKKEAAFWVSSYWEAFKYYPHRAEPLFWINTHYLAISDYNTGYELAKKAQYISYPDDDLPIERWIYEYGLFMQLSDFCYFLGKRQEAKEALDQLLEYPLPSAVRRTAEEKLKKLYN